VPPSARTGRDDKSNRRSDASGPFSFGIAATRALCRNRRVDDGRAKPLSTAPSTAEPVRREQGKVSLRPQSRPPVLCIDTASIITFLQSASLAFGGSRAGACSVCRPCPCILLVAEFVNDCSLLSLILCPPSMHALPTLSCPPAWASSHCT
jgi:hypothetical protein